MNKIWFKNIAVLLVTGLVASLFASPAKAVAAISVGTTVFGAGTASNVGITLSGFDETVTYQATVKFVNTTTNLDVTNGTLVATQGSTSLISGYTSYSAAKIGFRGSYSAVAAALSTVTWNPTSASGDVSIRIGLAPYIDATTYYDANEGHYYRYISTAATWTNARTAAEATYLYGLRGYLAEINTLSENTFITNETSATNIWIGAREDTTTAANYTGGTYNGTAGQRWIWEGAIQTPLPTGSGVLAQSNSPAYSGWLNGEPNNDVKPGPDCAVTHYGGRGTWNDLECAGPNGYLIEFGGRPGETSSASIQTLTTTVTARSASVLGSLSSNVSCTFGVNCSFPLSLTNPTAKNLANADLAGTWAYTSSNTASTTVSAVSGGASVALVSAGTSTITATFTPTDPLYATNTKTFTVTVTAVAPSAPTGLIATPGNTTVQLSWTPGSNGGSAITDYVIYYSTDNADFSIFADGTSTNTSASVTGLINQTLYYFKVAARNVINTGATSAVVSSTPSAPAVAGVTITTTSTIPTTSTTSTIPTTSTTSTIPTTSTTVPASPTTTVKPKRTIKIATDLLETPPPPAEKPAETGSVGNPAPLVERNVNVITNSLKPVVVNIFDNPKPDAPVLTTQDALDLVNTPLKKKIGASPSLVLFDEVYQPSKVVIVDDTVAQIVAPSGGVLNVVAQNGDTPVAVNSKGRVQMLKSDSVVADGNGLAPNTEFAVYVFSDPVLLGIGKTNGKGEFFISFLVQNSIPLGDHTLQVNGQLADGRKSSVSMPVTVVDVPETSTSEGVVVDGVEAPVNEAPVKKTTESSNSWIWIAAFALVILLVGYRWWWLLARRKRDQDEELNQE